MDQDAIEDLKQFITSTVYQATSHLATREEMNRGFKNVMSAIAETMDKVNDRIFGELDDHENRIKKVERKVF